MGVGGRFWRASWVGVLIAATSCGGSNVPSNNQQVTQERVDSESSPSPSSTELGDLTDVSVDPVASGEGACGETFQFGARARVRAEGFAPGESVAISFVDDPSGAVTEAIAELDGSIGAEIEVPRPPEGVKVPKKRTVFLSFRVEGTAPDGTSLLGLETIAVTRRTETCDNMPPTIELVAPVDGATYTVQERVIARYHCADQGSGLYECNGSVPLGKPIDTEFPGEHVFSVGASDRQGNYEQIDITYEVIFPKD